MHISTIICIFIAAMLMVACSQYLDDVWARQRVARKVLDAWRNVNRKKVQQ